MAKTLNQVVPTFVVAIANGASSVPVAFIPAFAAKPRILGIVVEKALAGDPETSPQSVHTLTAAGCVVELSGAVPNGNYKLHLTARI